MVLHVQYSRYSMELASWEFFFFFFLFLNEKFISKVKFELEKDIRRNTTAQLHIIWKIVF